MKHLNDGKLEHHRAWGAIPWTVNGSATEAQRVLVEAHVRECQDCREEMARQRLLHGAMSAEQRPVVTDTDASLQRLLERIDQSADGSAEASSLRARPKVRRAGAGALVYGLTFALAIESVAVVVLGMGLLSRTERAPAFQTLSNAPSQQARVTIRIVPAPGMQLGELAQLLGSLDLQIVTGPNAAGGYGLAPLSQQVSADSQIARLRAAPGMRLVEPVGSTGSAP